MEPLTLECRYLARSIFNVNYNYDVNSISFFKLPYIYSYEIITYPQNESFKKHKNDKPICLTKFLTPQTETSLQRCFRENPQVKIIHEIKEPIIGCATNCCGDSLKEFKSDEMTVDPIFFIKNMSESELADLENEIVLNLLRKASMQIDVDSIANIHNFNQAYNKIEEFDYIVDYVVMNLNTFNEIFFDNEFLPSADCLNDILDLKLSGNGDVGHLFTSNIIIFNDIEEREVFFINRKLGNIVYDLDFKNGESYSKFMAYIPEHFKAIRMRYRK